MLIVLNHKMNLNIDEIKEYEKRIRDLDVIVMPQTPYMGLFTDGKYTLGSQCISEYTATGGVSAQALVGMNTKYVLVGHSERRILRDETEEVIIKKIQEILDNNMIPILCVGENINERDTKENVLRKQLSNVFDMLNSNKEKIIVAYEPVWSIGTNHLPDVASIIESITFIKNFLEENYKSNNQVLYGGSINVENITLLSKIKIIDGFIIGNASLNVDNIINIYNIIRNQME